MSEFMADAHRDAGPRAVWSLARKVGFRFLFCYIALFSTSCLNLVFVIDVYCFTGRFPASPVDRFLGVIVPFVARHLLLQRSFRYQAFAGGDSLSAYLGVFTYILIALLGTISWSLLRRKTTNYSRLNQWLRLYAQLFLAATLFSYGFDKVFPLQFGALDPTRLVTSVGDETRFSILWLCMAASTPYTIFSGVLELLTGVMMVIPKLRSTGALLAVAVLTNVFAINLFYDVSVKLFSLELLLLAVVLAAPDSSRLFRLLVLVRTVEPRREASLSNNQRVGRWAVLAQGGLAACLFAAALVGSAQLYARRQAAARDVPLAGVWVVDSFQSAVNSQPLLTAKLATDLHVLPGDDRWTKFVVGGRHDGVVQLRNGVWDSVDISVDKDHMQLEMSDSDDANWKVHFAIHRPNGKSLELEGSINGVPVDITLHADVFRLTTDKYHFIRTYP